ncbi:MAG: hypothetical protein QG622_582 [Actinomycetota bacterium]|nr:hypothetical protein [Actinomycetota bacterium]
MCGRYVASRRPEDLAEEFEIDTTGVTGPGDDPAGAVADFNVAPTKKAPVVLAWQPRGVPAGEGGPVRLLRLLRWGLVPPWAKDPSSGNRMINARVETVLDKPAFRRAARTRRCLVPADGWYEWRAGRPADGTGDGAGDGPRRQPFFLRPVSGGTVALAGLFELWRNPDGPPGDPSSWLATYAVITMPAEPGLEAVHDRMPLVLPPDRWSAWLDSREQDPDTVRVLLRSPDAGRFEAFPVSPEVNAVGNNGPHLVEPVRDGSRFTAATPRRTRSVRRDPRT